MSGTPSPSRSAKAAACASENATPPGIFRCEIAHDVVTHERDVSSLMALLLKPGKPPTMSANGCDHIIQAIAIHVVNTHFRAPVSKRLRMEFPEFSPAPSAGCSHHPRLFTRSMRPSPLMSPIAHAVRASHKPYFAVYRRAV